MQIYKYKEDYQMKKKIFNLIQNVFFIIELSRSYRANYFLEVCNTQG